MKSLLLLAGCQILIAGLLPGCAMYSREELAGLSQRRIAPATMAKLRESRPLSPDDVIELRRRGVADTLVIRHLEKGGVDSLFTRHEVGRLRGAGVSPRVIDAAIFASDEFAGDHHEPEWTGVDYYGAGYGEPPAFYGSVGWGTGFYF